jgi:hypothetical protein
VDKAVDNSVDDFDSGSLAKGFSELVKIYPGTPNLYSTTLSD